MKAPTKQDYKIGNLYWPDQKVWTGGKVIADVQTMCSVAAGEEVAWAMCNTQRGHRDMLTSSEIELLEIIEKGLKNTRVPDS